MRVRELFGAWCIEAIGFVLRWVGRTFEWSALLSQDYTASLRCKKLVARMYVGGVDVTKSLRTDPMLSTRRLHFSTSINQDFSPYKGQFLRVRVPSMYDSVWTMLNCHIPVNLT